MSRKFNTDIAKTNEGFVDSIIDYIEDSDSPNECYAKGIETEAKCYDQKRIPGKVATANASVGVARVKDGILEAEARGPNAGAVAKATALGVEANAGSCVGNASAKVGPIVGASAQGPNAGAGAHAKATGIGAGFNLGLGSASANLGPITATAGLDIDTGISAGLDGFSANVLGTGISLGGSQGFSISFLGSSIRLF